MTVSTVNHRLALTIIVGLAVATRLALVASFGDQPLAIWDERDYDVLASNLVKYGEFAFEPGKRVSLRPPLYPGIVAAVYSVAGIGNHQAVRYIQIVLAGATVLLVYDLGRRLFDSRIGLCAAAWYAFYPSLVAYCGLLLTETLFTFLLVATLCALTRAVSNDSLRYVALAGVLLGLAALTRSVLWLFPGPAILLLANYWPGSLPRRLFASAVFAGAFAAALAPWSMRNSELERTFIAVDSMGGRNLMMGNYEHTPLARTWAAIEIEGEQSWHQVLRRKRPEAAGMTQGQFDKLAMREGIRYALANPGLTLQRDAIKFLAFWGLERELIAGVMQGRFGAWSKLGVAAAGAAIAGTYAASLVLALFGLFLFAPKDRFLRAAIVTTVLFICALHTLSFGHSRYHLPLMPLLFPFSAVALLRFREAWNRRRSIPFRIAFGLSVLLVLGWVWEAYLQDKEWIDRILGGEF
jgi:4-amino-4-deoxy-L-arabinose transferase-like glycosyltransferase